MSSMRLPRSPSCRGNVRLFAAAFGNHGSGDERAGLVPRRPGVGEVGRHDRKELRAFTAKASQSRLVGAGVEVVRPDPGLCFDRRTCLYAAAWVLLRGFPK